MAQLTTAATTSSLRTRPGLSARIDLPRLVVFLAAASMVVIVVVLLGFIARQGLQLFIAAGYPITAIAGTRWAPDAASPALGLVPFVAGTVAVTAVALLFSAPLSVGLALFLSEIAPRWARATVQPALEIFVGIPSVVWGWLGLTILVPFLRADFGFLGFDTGFSWLAGSLVLTVMVLPTITSVSYDAFRAVPQELRSGSLALGTTRWQTIRHILVPAALPGVLTGVVLGMTRAAGEALAVQMVIGGRPIVPTSLTEPMATLTSQITVDMGNTVLGEPWNDALWTMSLLLLLISMGSVVLVRLLNRRRTVA